MKKISRLTSLKVVLWAICMAFWVLALIGVAKEYIVDGSFDRTFCNITLGMLALSVWRFWANRKIEQSPEYKVMQQTARDEYKQYRAQRKQFDARVAKEDDEKQAKRQAVATEVVTNVLMAGVGFCGMILGIIAQLVGGFHGRKR